MNLNSSYWSPTNVNGTSVLNFWNTWHSQKYNLKMFHVMGTHTTQKGIWSYIIFIKNCITGVRISLEDEKVTGFSILVL